MPRLVPAAEIEARIAAFQAALEALELDAALIVEAADLFYLTGTVADAHLVVPARGTPAYLVRRDPGRARLESPLERVEPLRSLRHLPALVADVVGSAPRRLGLELDVLPAASYLRYAGAFAGVELADAGPALRAVRAVKSAWELERIRAAARILADAQAHAVAIIGSAATDRDLQVELEHRMRRHGHQGPCRFRGMNGEMFYGAVLAGADAAVPSHADTPLGGPGASPATGRGPGGARIGPGSAVTVDLVGARDGYLADQTRTILVGDVAPPLPEALACCVAILAELEPLMRPGVPAGSLYERGLELASAAGFGDGYMGAGPSRVRFVGHGVGLEINEPPFLAAGVEAPLEAGNVIAVEPKLVFPGLGAVGIENTYLVAAGGGIRLTPDPVAIDGDTL